MTKADELTSFWNVKYELVGNFGEQINGRIRYTCNNKFTKRGDIMLNTKLKLLSITLFIFLTTLTVSKAHACEPPPLIPWYHLSITTFSPELPPMLEISVQDQYTFGEDSLILTNNTSTPIYIVRDMDKVSDLRAIYEDDNPSTWMTQVDLISREYPSVPPKQTTTIYHANYHNWSDELSKWPEDYGGRRPADVTLPDPRSNGLALVHQGGIHLVPFTESIILNPEYPDKAYWNGCPEEYYEDPVPVPVVPVPVVPVPVVPVPVPPSDPLPQPVLIATEDNAVTNNIATGPIWVFVGITLLAVAAAGIYWWKD